MDAKYAAFERWMTDVRGLRGATVAAYMETLHKLDGWMGERGVKIEALTASDLEAFMSRPRTRVKIGSPATQDRDRSALQSFWKWGCARGVFTVNPTIDVAVPKVRNRAPRAVPDDTWVQLWSSPLADDDRAWLGLMCFAGLRRWEMVSLRPEQVDDQRGLLLHLNRKGGNEDAVEYEQMAQIIHEGLPRVLPDVDAWLAAVSLHKRRRAGERCFVTFDMPTTPQQAQKASWDDVELPAPRMLNQQLQRLLRRAKLDENAFTPHALRHTAVTNLLRCRVPIHVVSDAVGHTDINTTRRYVKTAGLLSEWRERLGR